MECVNCIHPLQKSDKFCPKCGNEVFCKRITIRSLINEFFSKYFSLESKLLGTIKDMTIHPEKVIKSYINNNRVKYLPPINFMIIAGLLGGFYTYLLNNGYLGEMNYEAFSVQAEQQDNPIGINQVEVTKSINNEIQKYYSLVLFLTIPLLALISKLVFHNYKQYNFAEHSVIYAYGYSQYLVLSYISIPFALVFDQFIFYYTIFSSVFIVGYHVFVLKRVFEISWIKMMIKTLFFLAIFIAFALVLMILGGVIVFLYLVLSGEVNAN